MSAVSIQSFGINSLGRKQVSEYLGKSKVHTTNLIYNVNYKGEVGTRFLGFREKNNFYFPMSDKGSEKCH